MEKKEDDLKQNLSMQYGLGLKREDGENGRPINCKKEQEKRSEEK